MAMTFDQIQARAATLVSLEKWNESSPAPDWAALVSRAYYELAFDSELYIGTETLPGVNGQVEYTLAASYKRITDITFNQVGLLRSCETFERNLNPSWRNLTAGTPLRWIQTGLNKVAIVPPPSGTQTIAIRGIATPPAMSAGTDLPALAPTNVFGEMIAMKAAILHGKVYAQGEGLTRLSILQQQYDALIAQAHTMLHNDDSPKG